MNMPGEQPPFEVSVSAPNIDDAIDSFRNRRTDQEAADAAAVEAARERELAGLPPEVAEAKRRLQDEISKMASETRSPAYSSSNRRPSRYSGLSRQAAGVAVAAGSAALSLGIWYGTTAITEATYGQSQAQSYLEQQGYTHVTDTGTNILFMEWQGCGADDLVQYNFEATSLNGMHVSMMVCKGLFKAATSRQG